MWGCIRWGGRGQEGWREVARLQFLIGSVPLGCGPMSRIRTSSQCRRAKVQRVPAGAHFPSSTIRWITTVHELTQRGVRGIFQNRFFLPVLRSFDTIVDSINVTSLEGVFSRRHSNQSSTNVWYRRRGRPTQLPQFTLERLSRPRRQEASARRPQSWGCRNRFQRIRKVPLGQLSREIVCSGQFHPDVP